MSKNDEKYKSLKDRIEEQIFYSPDGCWYWTGYCNNYNRAMIWINTTYKVVARVYYEIVKNITIPKDLFACHSCDNPRCINPDHIFLGTPKDNTQDMIRKGRGVFTGGDHREKVNQYDLDWNFIKTWDSMKEAAENLGLVKSGISMCSLGKKKKCGGFRWKKLKDCL